MRKKKMILEIYGVNLNDIDKLKKYRKLVLTQPLDIDFGITEVEKVAFYAKHIGGYGVNDIVIKPHPREHTDYSKYFPNAYFFDKKVPSQMFKMCGVKFDEIYTINSSSVFQEPSSIIIHKLKYK